MRKKVVHLNNPTKKEYEKYRKMLMGEKIKEIIFFTNRKLKKGEFDFDGVY